MRAIRRLWRRVLRVDCAFCVNGEHVTCEIGHSRGCMCRIIDNHAGVMA